MIDPVCVKCGAQGATIQVTYDGDNRSQGFKQLICQCLRCGYGDWYIPCLDAKKKDVGAVPYTPADVLASAILGHWANRGKNEVECIRWEKSFKDCDCHNCLVNKLLELTEKKGG